MWERAGAAFLVILVILVFASVLGHWLGRRR